MSIKKKFIFKASLGFSLAIIIGIVVTALSISLSDETEIIHGSVFGIKIENDVTALLVELVLIGLLGIVGMGGSVVYELESWSLIKATVIHFICTVATYLFVGTALGWLSSEMGIWNAVQIAAYIVAYAIIWMIQSMIYKKEIKDINRGVELLKSRENTLMEQQ